MSRRLSGSFTAGFGTTAEAAAAENGKNLGCKEPGSSQMHSIQVIYIWSELILYHWIWMDSKEK